MVSENKITFRGLAVWSVCAVFFMYEFLLRTVLGTFQLPITADLQLSPINFAILSSTAYQLAYGAMQMPVGIITDRFGLKKTLLFAVIFCAAANLGFTLTHQFGTAVFFRVMMGFGSSFGFVCLLIAVYDWLPRKNAALFIGLSQFIGTLGPMLAAGPLNMLAEANIVNWREVFLGLGLLGAVIAFLVLLIVDNNREGTGKFIILSRPDKRITDHLKKLVREPQIWYIAIFSSCVYFSIEYLSENEGIRFLQLKGLSSSFSSYMITLSWLGYAIGCPLLGFISDFTQKRKPVMVASILVAIVALISIIYFPLTHFTAIVSFVLLGIGASGQSVGFAIMAEQCRDEYLALGLGFNNGMMMLFAAINAPFIGFILSHFLEVDGVASITDYKLAFIVLFVLLVTGFLFVTFAISETFCKPRKTNVKLTTSVDQKV